MNDQPRNLPASSPPAKPTWNEPSPDLKLLLESSESQASDIARVPALVAEAKRLLPTLKARAAYPAGVEGVRSIIGRRLATYPQPDRTDGEWTAWWQDYFDALKDVPQPALEAAMTKWVRDPNEFLPKPGQLRYLATTTAYAEGLAYDRARKAVEIEPQFTGDRLHVEAPTARGIPEPTASDKAKVKRWASEFIASVGEKTAAAAPIRANQGAVDETGITPTLRALIEKQRAA